MSDRALEAAAEALNRNVPELWLPDEYTLEEQKALMSRVTNTVVAAYLDSLLGEPPEEAWRALMPHIEHRMFPASTAKQAAADLLRYLRAVVQKETYER